MNSALRLSNPTIPPEEQDKHRESKLHDTYEFEGIELTVIDA
jgi:hypothetical protein